MILRSPLRIILFCLTLIGVAQAQPVVGWFKTLTPILKVTEVSQAVQADANGNVYLLCSTGTSTYSYETMTKFDHNGNQLWTKTLTFNKSIIQGSFFRDGSEDVYVWVNLSDSTFVSHGSITRLSPLGAQLATHAFPSNTTILAGAADAQNNVCLGTSSQGTSHIQLSYLKVTPGFTQITSYTDHNLEPTSGSFNVKLDFVAVGYNYPSGAGEVESVPEGGGTNFQKVFPNQVINGADVSHHAVAWNGQLPGHVIIGDNITSQKSGVTTNTCQFSEVTETGVPVWSSTVFPGSVGNAVQTSPNVTFCTRSTTSQEFLMCVDNTGKTLCDTSVPTFSGLECGVPGNVNQACVAERDEVNGGYDQDIVHTSGQIDLKQVGTAVPGLPISGYGPATQTTNGFVMTDQVLPSGFNSKVYVQQDVSAGPCVSAVTAPPVFAGNPLTITVTLDQPTATNMPVTVYFQYSGMAGSSDNMTIVAGHSSGTITIPSASGGHLLIGSITAQGGGCSHNCPVAFKTDDIKSVVLTDTTITGGATWNATIDLFGEAPATGVTVKMTSDHPTIIPNASFVIDAGQTSVKAADVSNKPAVDTVVKLTWTDPATGHAIVTPITVKAS